MQAPASCYYNACLQHTCSSHLTVCLQDRYAFRPTYAIPVEQSPKPQTDPELHRRTVGCRGSSKVGLRSIYEPVFSQATETSVLPLSVLLLSICCKFLRGSASVLNYAQTFCKGLCKCQVSGEKLLRAVFDAMNSVEPYRYPTARA